MAAKFSEEMERFIECPICIEECTDPRVLPCLHSLCRACLDTYVNTSAKNNRFNCPACRRQCVLPAGGVTDFPKNFMLNSLKELLQQSQSQATSAAGTQREEPVCHNYKKGGKAKHTAPTVFCVNCAQFFCANCEEFHKMFDATSDHSLRPAGEVDPIDVKVAESKKKRPNCTKHPSQAVDIFCVTCQVPVCSSCCHLTHRQHSHKDLVEVAAESTKCLDGSKLKADEIESYLDEHLLRLNKSEKKIAKDGDEVCREIRKEADELRDFITKREQSMIQKVRSSQKDAAVDVKTAYKEAETNKLTVQSLRTYAHALQTSGDVIDQVTHTPGLQEQLRKLEAVPQLSVSWTVNLKRNTQSVAALSAMIGTVSVDKTVVKSDDVDDSMKKALGDPVLSLKPKVNGSVSGLVVIDDCVYVTGCWPDLLVYNIQTHTNKQHTITDMEAVGMTTVHDKTNNNNTIVITDNNNKIHFVTISPQNMNITKHTVKDIPFRPRHVSVDSKTGKLIIANNTDKQIVVCDNTGNIENRVTVKTSIGNMMCVLTTDDGFVVLDGSSPGRVHWVTKAGDVTHTYGQRDGEHLNHPWHMTFDPDGRLIVSDCSNHRLHMIDVNKQLFDYVLTDKDDIRRPRNVYLDKTTQRLFVGHSDTKHDITVSVYNWPYRPTSGTHHTLNVQLNRYT